MYALTFGILLALDRTRIWLLFHAPIGVLIGAGVAVFGLLKWAAYTVGRRTDQPPQEPPALS